jgi:uncharacterized protein (DUF2249 family)
VLSRARAGDCTAERDELHEWYRAVLLPHIIAEEEALYSQAADFDTTRLLVSGMLVEHRALVTLMAELALARQPLDVATISASALALFRTHLIKENDLLLPALDAAGLDLAAALDGLQDVAGHSRPAADTAGGCNCGHDAGAEELDVRALPHGQRHEIIFAKLGALGRGETLLIVNDHDPKPLRYQTSALWPGRFGWTYHESGPQVWQVAITRVG